MHLYIQWDRRQTQRKWKFYYTADKKQRKKTGFIFMCSSSFAYTVDKQCWRFSMGKMFSLFTFSLLPMLFMRFGVVKIAMWSRRVIFFYFAWACLWLFSLEIALVAFEKLLNLIRQTQSFKWHFRTKNTSNNFLLFFFFFFVVVFMNHFCIDLLFKYVCSIIIMPISVKLTCSFDSI